MSFKEAFLAALRKGQTYESLLELAHHHQALESTPGETYKVLEDLWREHGFDAREEDSELQRHLEAVMERIWYRTPA